MFEVVVAYYFAFTFSNSNVYTQVGPFSTESQCTRMVNWIGRSAFTTSPRVSECWYGPALSSVRDAGK